jgi:hypothetical protein
VAATARADIDGEVVAEMTPEDRYQRYMAALETVTELMDCCVSRKARALLDESHQKLITAFGTEMIGDTARKP